MLAPISQPHPPFRVDPLRIATLQETPWRRWRRGLEGPGGDCAEKEVSKAIVVVAAV